MSIVNSSQSLDGMLEARYSCLSDARVRVKQDVVSRVIIPSDPRSNGRLSASLAPGFPSQTWES